ncbi:MAG TPA: O-antigen ligase family protein [Terriglobales bacterium]
MLLLPGMVWGVLALAALVLAFLFAFGYVTLRGYSAPILLAWVLLFPLGYHFVAFPKDQAIITLDRILIGLLLFTTFLSKRTNSEPLSNDLRNAALWWILYVGWALIRVPGGKAPMSAIHIVIDALFLPAVLGWYTVRYFDVRRYLPILHALTCIASVYVAGIGFAEILLQDDLLPVTGGGIVNAGNMFIFLIRPNGPFGSDNSLAIFGTVSLVFLLFVKNVLGASMPRWQRALHRIGIAAALASVLLPLFRSAMISLAVMFVLDALFFQVGRRRQRRMMVVLAFGFLVLLVRLVLPVIYEERTDSYNLFGRVAAYKQTFALFADNPLTGVGLNNYIDAAQSTKYVTFYQDVISVDSPHSSVGEVLAETGLIGFVPWLLSQIFLVRCFWKLRQSKGPDGNTAWRWFLFAFLGYTINGLTLSIIYSMDVNYWYLFVLMLFYKFGITGNGAATGSHAELMSGNL